MKNGKNENENEKKMKIQNKPENYNFKLQNAYKENNFETNFCN